MWSFMAKNSNLSLKNIKEYKKTRYLFCCKHTVFSKIINTISKKFGPFQQKFVPIQKNFELIFYYELSTICR